MVLETSVAVAIVLEEFGYELLGVQLEQAEEVLMSAVSFMEASIVLLNRKGHDAYRVLDAFLLDLEVKIIPVDAQQARLAREAHAKFGKGRGHRAQLNLADCFSYALAKQRNEPLLFVGNDFIYTDVLRP